MSLIYFNALMVLKKKSEITEISNVLEIRKYLK